MGKLRERIARRGAALVTAVALALAASGDGAAWQEPSEPKRTGPSMEDLHLEISKPGLSLIRMALPRIPSGIQGAGDVAHETLMSDMRISGVVAVVDPALYDQVKRLPDFDKELEQWRSIQARVLLRAEVYQEGDKLVLEGRLYDLESKKMILGKRYRGSAAVMARIAHTLANDIILYFTGKPGIFLTKVAFVSDRDGAKEIYLMDFDGGNQQRLTSHRSLSMAPEWSDTGDSIVYCSWHRGSPHLFLMFRADGRKRQLTDSGSLNISPAISPDGTKIVFVRSLDGNPEIFVVNRDGSNMKQLTSSRAIDASPSWSPTGREIAFTSNRGGSPQVYVMDAEGTNLRRLTTQGTWNDEASWSPDGKRMTYTARNRGIFQIVSLDLGTGRLVQLTSPPGNSEESSWSPDGSKLVFTSTRSGRDQIYSMNADGGSPVQLTSDGNNFSPDWSRYLP